MIRAWQIPVKCNMLLNYDCSHNYCRNSSFKSKCMIRVADWNMKRIL